MIQNPSSCNRVFITVKSERASSWELQDQLQRQYITLSWGTEVRGEASEIYQHEYGFKRFKKR